jgi:hypothetical protein
LIDDGEQDAGSAITGSVAPRCGENDEKNDQSKRQPTLRHSNARSALVRHLRLKCNAAELGGEFRCRN